MFSLNASAMLRGAIAIDAEASASASAAAGPAGAASPGVGPPVKAEIINLDGTTENITCLFNPKQYAFRKENTWTLAATNLTSESPLHFGSGTNATTQLDLVFDTYATGEDVRTRYTEPLWTLTLVDTTLTDHSHPRGRPPHVRFHWGTSWNFDAVITTMTQTFSLFAHDGTPLRASVSLALKQLPEQAGLQNPTSQSEHPPRVWTVREGDSLAWIAYTEYGRTSDWRQIADANRLTDLRRLVPGMKLEIPHAG
jgi:nucleoid-associated protein YgaU